MLSAAASLRSCASSSARAQCRRSLATSAASSSSSTTSPSLSTSSEPLTHYRITLRRSAISLPQNIKGTLEALGITDILTVKELVTVENVPASAAPRGYSVTGSKLQSDL
ncbi:hypothetical protein C8T65DRAFT_675553 [Cerioporus squamosus]|nr:hypothetical protein C8T65DRAFT_675553 [Cerioporus squamosus]